MKIRISEIKIPDRFRKDSGDIKPLAISIQKQGLLHPVVVRAVNGSYVLVCGYRRIAAHKYLGLDEIEATIVNMEFDSREAEADENIVRKDFTVSEISEIDEFYREKEEAKARLRQKEGKPMFDSNKGRSSKIIADKLAICYSKLLQIRGLKAAVIQNPSKYKPFWDRAVRTNRVDKPYNKVLKLLRIEQAEKQASATVLTPVKEGKFDFKLGDFRELSKEIVPNSVDMIFTDPLYAKKHSYYAESVGLTAFRVLKEGRSAFIIAPNTGESFEYWFDMLRKCGLKFVHYIALVHTGRKSRLHDNGIQVLHKPILWFFKPGPGPNSKPKTYTDIQNVIESKAPLKENHDMEQSTVEAEYLIRRMTVTGEIVYDPFTGSGTTGEAALKHGRYFRGSEIDPVHYANAINRLNSLNM